MLNNKNLKRCSLSHGDIMEEIRLTLNQNTMENIDEIFMERTGKISMLKTKKST
jgi:uncharacterized membrane protein YcaP (DUF421 family)